MKKINFLYQSIIAYKHKIFKIISYEIFYSIINSKNGKSFKPPHIHPCPYYFNHKISQFINKNKNEIKKVIELGCGFGRITNFLSNKTQAKIYGYELDKEAYQIAKKNISPRLIIKQGDILKLNFRNLKFDTYILNNPFYLPTKKNFTLYEKLIKKIYISKKKSKKKYYIIAVNFLNKKHKAIFKNYKLVKTVEAGTERNVNIYRN
tara:strand:- start:1269 stop:1886 length:618 start_codon:yes stop_codon:yes gene_type:complete